MLTRFPFYKTLLGIIGVGGAFYFSKKYYIDGPMCTCKAVLTGKTAIVTGANTGIGLETAVGLAQRGARVILACRSEEKGESAAREVRARSNNKEVFFFKLDLSSLQSIHAFSAKILEEEPQIDILVNNAGVMNPSYTKTEDGFELLFGVNHLSHFLLTNLLLERMKDAPCARVVNVSSYAHENGKINFDDLQSERFYSSNTAYSQSKLANVLFTQSLAKKLQGSKVSAYSLHPGFIHTEIVRNMNGILVSLVSIAGWLFLRSPLQGAQTTIHCAVSEEVVGKSGEYFADCKVKKLKNPQATDGQIAERLWQVSAQLVGLKEKQ